MVHRAHNLLPCPWGGPRHQKKLSLNKSVVSCVYRLFDGGWHPGQLSRAKEDWAGGLRIRTSIHGVIERARSRRLFCPRPGQNCQRPCLCGCVSLWCYTGLPLPKSKCGSIIWSVSFSLTDCSISVTKVVKLSMLCCYCGRKRNVGLCIINLIF